MILALNGRFDAQNTPEVKQAIGDALKAMPNLVIDLAEVTFIDSAALATLVHGMKSSRAVGGDLRICNLQSPVRTIFELTRLDKAFAVFDSRGAAVVSFR